MIRKLTPAEYWNYPADAAGKHENRTNLHWRIFKQLEVIHRPGAKFERKNRETLQFTHMLVNPGCSKLDDLCQV